MTTKSPPDGISNETLVRIIERNFLNLTGQITDVQASLGSALSELEDEIKELSRRMEVQENELSILTLRKTAADDSRAYGNSAIQHRRKLPTGSAFSEPRNKWRISSVSAQE